MSTGKKILDRITTPWHDLELVETPKGLELQIDGITLNNKEIEDLRRIVAQIPRK